MNTGETRQSRRTKYLNMILIIVLILFATVFYSAFNTTPVTYSFEDDAVTLTGNYKADHDTVTIDYSDILSVTTCEMDDPGTYIEGLDGKKARFGTWESDRYGTYTLCAWSDCDFYIVIETTDGYLLCNYEDEDATQSLADSFLELLEESGYLTEG